MSSPIAKPSKGVFDRLLIRVHQGSSHNHRIGVLSGIIGKLVRELDEDVRSGLDIGCGDMALMHLLEREVPGCVWSGADLYQLPAELGNDPQWDRYTRFDGRTLPFSDAQFDIALFCDVLHHADQAIRTTLLSEALRVAGTVVVKDHFEYGPYSRTMLRAMDFVGNFGYGVSVPERYFTRSTFTQLVESAGGAIGMLRVGMQLYDQLGPAKHALRPNWHFLAVIRRCRQTAIV